MRRASPACLALLLVPLAACDRAPAPDAARTAPAASAPAAIAPASAAPPAAPATSASASAVATPPGTEPLAVVTSPVAPLLAEIGPGVNASVVLHAGDLVHVGAKHPPLSWHARINGVEATREGAVVEVHVARDDSPRFTFASDLGETLVLPSGERVCERLLADAPPDAGAWRERCPSVLRRARLAGDRVAAFIPCAIGACPVASVRGDDVRSIRVDGITAGELRAVGGGGAALFLTTRWVKDEGKRTGGALAIVTFDGPAPKVASTIRLDEIDARDAVRVDQRDVRVEIGATEVRVVGERRSVSRVTAAVSGATPIDERHPLPAR